MIRNFKKIIYFFNKKSQFKSKISSKKIYVINKIMYLYILLIFILVLFNLYFKSYKLALLSLLILNIYISFIFLIYYPKDRIKLIKYINRILDDKKNEFVKELNDINKSINNIRIKKLILKDDDDYDIMEWDIKDKTSLIIGKGSKDNVVDIDFSNSEYSYLISRNHGIINKVNESWYYEDLASINGSGIEKKNGEKIKLLKNVPYKLEVGDFLYISILKILVS